MEGIGTIAERGKGWVSSFQQLSKNYSLEAWDMKAHHTDHLTIKGGAIDYDGKATRNVQDNSLWTKNSYGNIEMYAEWRLPQKPTMKPTPIVLYNGGFLMGAEGKRVTRPHLDDGDSGLMFRGTSKCQFNIWSMEPAPTKSMAFAPAPNCRRLSTVLAIQLRRSIGHLASGMPF